MCRLLPLALLLAASATAAAPRTLGLFVAAPEGVPGRPPLPSAGADATRLRDTLVQLGGLARADAVLLERPTADAVLLALGELEARAREATAAGDEVTLLVWCAGYATGDRLQLGPQEFDLGTLRALLQTSPAARRLALFDLAGSERRLAVTTPGAPGLAVLTSESPDAAAWSAPLAGMSHLAFHVVNGLRGAADADGDEAITPAELLGWVASRARRPAPPLEGSWAPLTRLPPEGLRLDATVSAGAWVIADADGRVAGELDKRESSAHLWLPPGRYVVKQRTAEGLRLASVELVPGEHRTVAAAQLVSAPLSADPVRQPGGLAGTGRRWSLSAGADYRLVTAPALPSLPLLGAELTLQQVVLGGVGFGLDGGFGWASGSRTVPLVGALPWSATLTTVGLSARYEWLREGPLVPFAGVRLGLDFLARRFEDPTWALQSATVLAPGAFAGLKVRLGLGLSVVARARVSYVGLEADDVGGLGAADLGLQLRYEIGG
jgi:hypothetical protein